MSVSAALVKQLRDRTGAGMMECKKALVQTNGDVDAAAELMRKTGLAKADKKAGRVAAEGLIILKLSEDRKRAAIVEVNSETDFVASGEDFKGFTDVVADCVLEREPADVEALSAAPLSGGETVEEARRALVAKIGENINVRRFELLSSPELIGSYLHGGRIGVLVAMQGGDAALAKDIAMHVAASNPVCVKADDVPAETLDKEREILTEQAKQEGKPPEIVAKMVEGRLKKYLAEITLEGQPFVKDLDTSVGKLLKAASAKVIQFVRYEVGEGIEKKKDNFVEEVMAQVRGD